VYDLNNELYHHGVLGMHWGVRRYQNADGTLTAAGRKRLEKKEAQTEADKQAIIKSGSAEVVKQHQAELSNQELKDAIERINLNQRLSEVNAKKKEAAAKKVERVANTVKSVSDITSSGVKIYNTVATVRNTFTTKSNTWRTIGGKKSKDKKNSNSESVSETFTNTSSTSNTATNKKAKSKAASFVNQATQKAKSSEFKQQAKKATQRGKTFTSSTTVESTGLAISNTAPRDLWFDFSGN
jgi:hypothetical protein